MMDEAVDGAFKGLYVQGEDIAQSDPDTQHITAGLTAMECVIVQDLFLNETARYAHVFLPGASFLEKDGTFTNAERRISRVRKAMAPLGRQGGLGGDCIAFAEALGMPMSYNHPSEIMDEIAALTPTFAGVTYAKLDELGSVQWPCNDAAPEGTPIMHVDRFVRGKGQFMLTEYVPTERAHRAALPAAADHRAHPLAIQRRRADAAHREQPLARGGRAGNPSVRRRKRGIRRRRSGRRCRAASATSRCVRKSPSACSRASSTRRSIIPAPAPMW